MKAFWALLDSMNEAAPDQYPALERLIWDAYERQKAVLALDMSQFTLSVRREGIVSHLAKIRKMQLLTAPVVKASGGDVVKFEADNLLAIFDDPAKAVHAAIGINRAVSAVHLLHGDGRLITVAIGIDYGRLLSIPDTDCFGDPVNIAYKLAEDVATSGEILITQTVRDILGESALPPLEELALSVSGVALQAYKVLYYE
ncbi:MAG: adenylate/guanylate cyclase domain-containing protein [Candidatus Sumerlaeota bacterium]|nr:adenylate/guanylate cyclase domain-containing protein [Candidatus Sumerlaeota bacterium]